MSTTDFDIIRNAIVAADEDAGMVLNYALVFECVDNDGTAAIQTITDCDHAWQVLGMLHHALLICETEKYHRDEDEG